MKLNQGLLLQCYIGTLPKLNDKCEASVETRHMVSKNETRRLKSARLKYGITTFAGHCFQQSEISTFNWRLEREADLVSVSFDHTCMGFVS